MASACGRGLLVPAKNGKMTPFTLITIAVVVLLRLETATGHEFGGGTVAETHFPREVRDFESRYLTTDLPDLNHEYSPVVHYADNGPPDMQGVKAQDVTDGYSWPRTTEADSDSAHLGREVVAHNYQRECIRFTEDSSECILFKEYDWYMPGSHLNMDNCVAVIAVCTVLGLALTLTTVIACQRSPCLENQVKTIQRPDCKHPYLVRIITGARPGAGMYGGNGTVRLTLSGDHFTSYQHAIDMGQSVGKRHQPVFTRNSERSFLVYTEESLGDLKSVALKLDVFTPEKWFVSCVSVVDMLLKKQWYAPANQWLNYEHGKANALFLTTAGPSKARLFLENVWQGFRKLHLWSAAWTPTGVTKTSHRLAHVLLWTSLLAFLMLTHMLLHTAMIWHIFPKAWISDEHLQLTPNVWSLDSEFVIHAVTANLVLFGSVGLLQSVMHRVKGVAGNRARHLKQALFNNTPETTQCDTDITKKNGALPSCWISSGGDHLARKPADVFIAMENQTEDHGDNESSIFIQDQLKAALLPPWMMHVVVLLLVCLTVAMLTVTALLGVQVENSNALWWLTLVASSLATHGLVFEPFRVFLLAAYKTIKGECIM